MKIGRNDPCPCGSGKKYKMCCRNSTKANEKDISNNLKQLLTLSDFPRIEQKLVSIKSILSEYKFGDLVIAIYCINLSLNNRSALESALTLNAGLLLIDDFGQKQISSYDDFKKFFERIEKKLPISIWDDFTIEDFGEIKLYWGDKTYDVITGTGHNQVFGMLQFLPYLTELLDKEEDLKSLLDYTSDNIEFFKKDNISNGEDCVRYLVPSEKLYKRTREYFNSELKKYSLEGIHKILHNENLPIEKRHFAMRNEQIFPLYNTSAIVDIYSEWLGTLDSRQLNRLVNITVFKAISELAKMDNREYRSILFPVSIIKDGKFLSRRPYAFCATTEEGIILAINEDEYEGNELINELKKIEALHKSNELNIAEVIAGTNDKECIGITVPSDRNMKIIIFNNATDITQHGFRFGERNDKYFRCSAIDLMYLLLFMDNFKELELFLNQDKEEEFDQMIGFGGQSTHFLAWKENGHMFAKGAVKYGMINLGHDIEISYVWDYYKDKLLEYPWGIDDFMFSSPFIWNIEDKGSGYFQYVNKIAPGFGGVLKHFNNNCSIFFIHNVEFYKDISFSEKQFEIISFIDDLNDRKIKWCENIFAHSQNLCDKLIQVLYMPIAYAKQVDNTGFTKDTSRKYVYSDVHNYNNNICIRYTVNIDNLYKDIQSAQDRAVETRYFLELFKPLEDISEEDYSALVSCLRRDVNLKKEVDVYEIMLDYYWTDKSIPFNINDMAYLKVRKEIAKLCKNIGIEPGTYIGKDVTKVIRTMQNSLIEMFENEVVKFNREQLHVHILSVYSNCIHTVSVHRKRYGAFNNVEEDVISEVQRKIEDMREEEKHHVRVLQYLLETNLNLKREVSRKCSNNEMEFLMAFANWLVVLQDNADLCFNSEKESHIEINFDFIVDVISEDEIELRNEGVINRIYNNEDYTIKGDEEDKAFIEAAIEGYKEDTGIDFKNMLSFIEYLQLAFTDFKFEEKSPNVMAISENELIQGFKDCLLGQIEEEEIINIINYLTIDVVKLKLWKGELRSFLPINEREQRDNRFEIKPLVKQNEVIIFSPVVMKDLHNKWKYGMTDFYLPYEIGLDNVIKVLEAWKKRYEDLMVYDIAEIFNKAGYKNVWPNAKLHSLDKKHIHPQKLGDYDLIAVDENKSEIWLIESKVLNKVGSIHEMYMQQSNFFLNHKYDEKFQRRIDYMTEHYREVLEGLKMNNSKKYEIKPYMVTNKILFSRYKRIKYPIISFYELALLLNVDKI